MPVSNQHESQRTRLFLSIPMDGRPHAEIVELFRRVESELTLIGLALSNPLGESPDFGEVIGVATADQKLIVDWDLERLRNSDAVLIDFSRHDHIYVGCICEMVYAHIWSKPIVAVVGTSGLDQRMWLRYHATAICADLNEGLEWVKKILL